MGHLEKTLEKWRRNPPTHAPIDKVVAAIKRWLPGRFERKPGSHMVIRDTRLASFEGFGPFGELTIPVAGGQRVKGRYLQRLARAIEIVEELETQ